MPAVNISESDFLFSSLSVFDVEDSLHYCTEWMKNSFNVTDRDFSSMQTILFLFNIHLLIRYFIVDWVNASDEVKSHHPGFKVKFIIFVLRTRQRKCVAWPTLKVWEGEILPSAMNSMFKNWREMQPVDLLPNKLVHCGETDSSVCMNFSLW